jgi:hypothetical protein
MGCSAKSPEHSFKSAYCKYEKAKGLSWRPKSNELYFSRVGSYNFCKPLKKYGSFPNMEEVKKITLVILFSFFAAALTLNHTNCSNIRLELVRGGNPATSTLPTTRPTVKIFVRNVCEKTPLCPNAKSIPKDECSVAILSDNQFSSKYFVGNETSANLAKIANSPHVELDVLKMDQCSQGIISTSCYSESSSLNTQLHTWFSKIKSCKAFISDQTTLPIEISTKSNLTSSPEIQVSWNKLDNSLKKYFTLFTPSTSTLEILDPARIVSGLDGFNAFTQVPSSAGVGDPITLSSSVRISSIKNLSTSSFEEYELQGATLQLRSPYTFRSTSWKMAKFISNSAGLYLLGWNETEWSLLVVTPTDVIYSTYEALTRPMTPIDSMAFQMATHKDDFKLYLPTLSGNVYEYGIVGAKAISTFPIASEFSSSKIATLNGQSVLATLDSTAGAFDLTLLPSTKTKRFSALNITSGTTFDISLDPNSSNIIAVLADPAWKSLQVLKVDAKTLQIVSHNELVLDKAAATVALSISNNKVIAALINLSQSSLKFLEIR